MIKVRPLQRLWHAHLRTLSGAFGVHTSVATSEGSSQVVSTPVLGVRARILPPARTPPTP